MDQLSHQRWSGQNCDRRGVPGSVRPQAGAQPELCPQPAGQLCHPGAHHLARSGARLQAAAERRVCGPQQTAAVPGAGTDGGQLGWPRAELSAEDDLPGGRNAARSQRDAGGDFGRDFYVSIEYWNAC